MDKFDLTDSLGFILNKVSGKLKNELLQEFKEYDITTEQWVVLNFLGESDGLPPNVLAALTHKDKPNINRILDKLKSKKLIICKPHPADGRSIQVFLTDSGRTLLGLLIPKAVGLLNKATKSIDEIKINELKVILNQIYNNLV